MHLPSKLWRTVALFLPVSDGEATESRLKSRTFMIRCVRKRACKFFRLPHEIEEASLERLLAVMQEALARLDSKEKV